MRINKQTENNNLRYLLVRGIWQIIKSHLNTWNTKYSQNVTCVCKNILSVKHITTELFQKNGYDFNASNNGRHILYNTDIINSIVKLIVRSPAGKLVYFFIF